MVYYCWIIYFRRSADLRLRTAGRSCSGRVVWKAERKQAPPRAAVSRLCNHRPDHLPQTHHAIPERNPCPPENCCPESHPTNSSHPSPERRRKRHHFLCVQSEATGLRMNFSSSVDKTHSALMKALPVCMRLLLRVSSSIEISLKEKMWYERLEVYTRQTTINEDRPAPTLHLYSDSTPHLLLSPSFSSLLFSLQLDLNPGVSDNRFAS